MSTPTPSAYLVNPESDPVFVRIEGKANFANSGVLGEFFTACLKQGKRRFLVDFQNCPSVDSTFLGVLAGVGLQLRKAQPPGCLALTRLNERNLDTMKNLGLTRICQVGDLPLPGAEPAKALTPEKKSELEQARLVLAAHENLVAADAGNQAKFQDVLTFMRDRVAKG